ncbi:hypothetical protein CO033_00110 [Candidatus Nomurabacteria bacterium CG_4_9_14_0_2_um_filter_32_10]|uniref:Prepilin-type N-terminal cleavage/methylation domain-containing protein n=2 Tax=Candidatus Nomuraibacteriota TaxID=1752729 RepID=A0A2J0MLL4_9BACT|nr:MAG: hypothetical protein COX94_01410 [Candidatus Nomurabacteria bacterium CG_4_10_14_0_2_um_filter_33_9]PJC49706.1 MAG: hypothetical protein CO033_00110 [Candidatus Nomurabacteria bacterium CG_4_9_14_0_2_um_filter_32_10]
MQNKKNNQSGYTIIETMISITIFLVVIMIGMSALLNVNLIHKKSQDMRSILDNLSFIMEDMSRNLRTGYDYYCGSGVSEIPLSCENGKTLFFEEATGETGKTDDQWGYEIKFNGDTYDINKSTDGGSTWIQLNPEEVKLSSDSIFIVTGAEPPNGDLQQPYVIIKLVGEITYRGVKSPFSLQTSVSQRKSDNIVISP